MLDKHIIQEPSNKHCRVDFLGWWLLKIHQGSHLDHQSQPVSQQRWKNLPRDPFFLNINPGTRLRGKSWKIHGTKINELVVSIYSIWKSVKEICSSNRITSAIFGMNNQKIYEATNQSSMTFEIMSSVPFDEGSAGHWKQLLSLGHVGALVNLDECYASKVVGEVSGQIWPN